MSQAGKILHLYVEVRSVPEDDGGESHLMLQCPETIPVSQRSSARSSPSPDRGYCPSKSPTRPTVSFQLQSPDATGSPTRFQRQDDPLDTFGHLLEVFAPKSDYGSLGQSLSPNADLYQETLLNSPSPTSPCRLSVPPAHRGRQRSYEAVDEDGRTSVVTFGFIDKASVHGATRRRNEPANPFQPNQTQKPTSHPAWYDRLRPPQSSPYLQRAAYAQDATYKALEEFGSPELRRRFAGYGLEGPSPPLPCRSPRCQSLGGSPSQSRSTLTLPSKTQLLELDRRVCRASANGLPRSPAYDRLSAQSGHSPRPAASVPDLHRPFQGRPRLGTESPRPTGKFQPGLPAGRPTDIQHEVSHIFTNPAYQARSGHHINAYRPSRCSSRSSDGESLLSDRTSVSPSSNGELDYKLAMEANKFENKHGFSPTPSQGESSRSESPNAGGSFLKDWSTAPRRSSYDPLHADNQKSIKPTPGRVSPQLKQRNFFPPASEHKCSSSPTKDLSGLHRYQTPQYTGDRLHPTLERRQNLTQVSPEVSRRQRSNENAESSRWTCREFRDRDRIHTEDSRAHATDTERGHRNLQKQLVQEYQKLFLGKSEDQRETRDPNATSSQSSSGAKGSFGSNSQLDRNQETRRNIGVGMQSNCDVAPTSSPRSQKLARAKWEFLFGAPKEESRSPKDSPAGGHLASSGSSLLLKLANQRRGRDGAGLSHHAVRQIELELVAPDPQTGVVRRSIKYSETDLDAVPLRCYQETDLDEVMRAEAEDSDSAFGSNRSVLETSSDAPKAGGSGDGGEDDEEEEEGEVAGWASVRMEGDRKKQKSAKEEDEVFSLLLKGTLEVSPDPHGDLKSPVSVETPRRPSESNMDSFSRHFESIMESHRAKGTSYSSLDSVDLLTSGSVFTFDLPTLTPEIQSQICESAKQIIELSFAPLARPTSDLALGSSEPPGARREGVPLRSRSEREPGRPRRDGFRKASSVPALHSNPRERSANRPPELLVPQADVAERLALGGSDEGLANGFKPDLQAAKRLAKRLYNLDGFRKSDVARHLGKNNDFSQMVAEEFLSFFDFSGQSIDLALRTFLCRFALVGETQERERVLVHFSKRYRKCNPDKLTNEDSVHTLTCALMLLNTDLHGNNVGKRMSCSQFISNLEGLNDGRDFPKDLLKTLYSSIKNEKLQWTIDEEELRKSVSELADARTDSASHTLKRIGGNPLVGVARQADGELYKSGFLIRKVHADPDGKRTPRGKRGWKTFYAMLKGLVLYLHKDECVTEQNEDDVKNCVSVHHSLAMRAADYSKRPNVFYLRTADWRVFLFQATNAEQMQSWITRINVVAAIFSAPPFPAAIGSQKRFSRPLLPGSSTKLGQEEQLKSHENRFRSVSSELLELAASTPERKVKGRELEEQKQRKEFLEFEKTRYGTYAMLLRARLAHGDEDLAAFESRLFEDGVGGLQRAHSSPTLPQDTAKEKSRDAKTSRSLKVTSRKEERRP